MSGESSKRCFSLIELLLVITIIAILTSLLLPALKKARDHAMNIACVGSMKQLALTSAMYYEDYKAFADDLSSGWWQFRYLNYMGETKPDDLWRRADVLRKKGLSCPAYTVDKTLSDGWNYRSYSYNGHLGKPFSWTFSSWDFTKNRKAFIKPEKWYLHLETDRCASTIFYNDWALPKRGANRHMGGSNVMYMDGHVVHYSRPMNFIPRSEGWDPY